MSLLLMEGFEDGIVNANVPGKWGYTGRCAALAGGRHGNKGRIELTSNASPVDCLRYDIPTAEQHATIVMGFAVLPGGASSNSANPYAFLVFQSDIHATDHISLDLDGNPMLTARRGSPGAGTALGTSAPLPAGVWSYVEVKVTLDDAAGVVVVKVNGNEEINFTGDTKNGGTKTVFDGVAFQLSRSNTTVFHDLDDIYICNGAGTSHNDFLNDHRVDMVLPNGNGARSELLGSDGDSVDNYLLVDDNPPDSADYVGSGVDGAGDTYLFADVPVGRTIAGVQTVQYSAKTDTGSKAMRQLARIGGTDYPGDTKYLGTGYQAYVRAMGVSPDSGVGWTEAEFNGAEFGVEVQP